MPYNNFDQFFEKSQQNLVERSEEMEGQSPNLKQQSLLYASLIDQLNPKNPLLKLGEIIPWDYFESAFSALYSTTGPS